MRLVRPGLGTLRFQVSFGLFLLACCGGCGSASRSSSTVAPSSPPPSPTPAPTSPPPPPTAPAATSATLYTMSNATSGNSILAYLRGADGSLTPAGSYATGGLGAGHGLENQGALVFSDDAKYLFVV